MRKLATLFGAVAVVSWAGCRVVFDDDALLFKCSADGECGGSGYLCVDGTYCCKVNGEEVEHGCDGRDNDCDGKTDEGAGSIELCNGLDDNCDGKIDEVYDLIQDPRHCGACDRSCMSNQACMNAVCVLRGETSCIDGMDNDMDAKIDCADTDCNLQGCGSGCQCRALAKAEGNCNDAADNDGDGMVDCADVDCDGAGCGVDGCVCANQAKKETLCADGMDNDGDTLTDCADPDCGAQLCQAAPSSFRCSGTSCSCNDGGTVAETAARCRDRVDNDCNGKVDCAEVACAGISCAPDGGLGCLCDADAGMGRETNCADRKDNDNDGFTDCGDVSADGGSGDCPFNTACTYLNTGGMVKTGNCAADHTCK